MDTSKRVALYARVSTSGQAQRALSIPEQFSALRAFCTERGWTVKGEFSDAGLSGASQARPEFQTMIKRALSSAHPFDLILMRDAARFGRGDEDQGLLARLRGKNVAVDNIESPTGNMDRPLTPGAKYAETVTWAADRRFREEIPGRIIASQRALARRGGLPGNQGRVFGYKSVWIADGNAKPKRTVVPHPENREIIKEIFKRYLVGGSIKAVTLWLNESGVEPPGNGKKAGLEWYDTTVRSLLTNETLLGQIVYGRIRKEKIEGSLRGTKRNVPNTETEIIRTRGAFPALIDGDTFNLVQARLAENTRLVVGAGNPGNVLRGIGKCSICGWHLAHQRSSSSERWYYMCGRVKVKKAHNCDPRCKGILAASYVDEVVALFISRTVASPGYANTLRSAVRRYNEAAQGFVGLSAFETLDASLVKMKIQIDNLVRQVQRTGSASLTDALVAQETKYANALSQRAEIEASVQVQPLSESELLGAAAQAKAALHTQDTSRLKTLLPELVSQVTVDWSKRVKPLVAYSYAFSVPRDLDVKHGSLPLPEEIVQRLTLAGEHSYEEYAQARADVAAEVASGAYEGLQIKMTVVDAPLIFVPKWDLGNIDRLAADAIERIGKALGSVDDEG